MGGAVQQIVPESAHYWIEYAMLADPDRLRNK
jgi:hypothetical protein